MQNSFSHERFRTFETEAQENSEMSYYFQLFQMKAVKSNIKVEKRKQTKTHLIDPVQKCQIILLFDFKIASPTLVWETKFLTIFVLKMRLVRLFLIQTKD